MALSPCATHTMRRIRNGRWGKLPGSPRGGTHWKLRCWSGACRAGHKRPGGKFDICIANSCLKSHQYYYTCASPLNTVLDLGPGSVAVARTRSDLLVATIVVVILARSVLLVKLQQRRWHSAMCQAHGNAPFDCHMLSH